LFSSIASLLGGAGQASYAMSCASLDALARFRRERGLAALAMNWGALAEVGMAMRYGDVAGYLSSTGVGMFTPGEAMAQFGRALAWPGGEVGIARMDWRQWASSYAGWAASPKYQALLAGSAPVSSSRKAGFAALDDVPEAEREAAVTQVLLRLLAETIDADPADLDVSVPLPSLGLDSLMAMDLLVAIEDRFGVKVPMLALMKGNSLNQLAQLVLAESSVPDGGSSGTAGPPTNAAVELPAALDLEQAERLIASLDSLADEEVERLLRQIMEEEEL
jgi:acyl carrier protein